MLEPSQTDNDNVLKIRQRYTKVCMELDTRLEKAYIEGAAQLARLLADLGQGAQLFTTIDDVFAQLKTVNKKLNHLKAIATTELEKLRELASENTALSDLVSPFASVSGKIDYRALTLEARRILILEYAVEDNAVLYQKYCTTEAPFLDQYSYDEKTIRDYLLATALQLSKQALDCYEEHHEDMEDIYICLVFYTALAGNLSTAAEFSPFYITDLKSDVEKAYELFCKINQNHIKDRQIPSEFIKTINAYDMALLAYADAMKDQLDEIINKLDALLKFLCQPHDNYDKLHKQHIEKISKLANDYSEKFTLYNKLVSEDQREQYIIDGNAFALLVVEMMTRYQNNPVAAHVQAFELSHVLYTANDKEDLNNIMYEEKTGEYYRITNIEYLSKEQSRLINKRQERQKQREKSANQPKVTEEDIKKADENMLLFFGGSKAKKAIQHKIEPNGKNKAKKKATVKARKKAKAAAKKAQKVQKRIAKQAEKTRVNQPENQSSAKQLIAHSGILARQEDTSNEEAIVQRELPTYAEMASKALKG